jgi:hypothetical protein
LENIDSLLGRAATSYSNRNFVAAPRLFQEKGGKSREIPVRHDLDGFILAYVEAAGIAGDAKDIRESAFALPRFRGG